MIKVTINNFIDARSGAGEKTGQGRGMNHGATSPSTGRVITPQVVYCYTLFFTS